VTAAEYAAARLIACSMAAQVSKRSPFRAGERSTVHHGSIRFR
jgi:hypothetical protein